MQNRQVTGAQASAQAGVVPQNTDRTRLMSPGISEQPHRRNHLDGSYALEQLEKVIEDSAIGDYTIE